MRWIAQGVVILGIITAIAGRPSLQTSVVEDYAWPLEAPPAMTSSFGEYREGRFHAGLDLKTWKTGYKVYAVDDGYVWRIRTSPWGYGAAVYLSLKSEKMATYGHLSAFAPKIAELVEKHQEEKEQYSVDIYLKKDQILIQRGELIGFSGDTGIGPPHLHFELRDRDNRPINPLAHGFSVVDSIRPSITRIAVSPVGSKSTVNGDHRPAILKLYRDEQKNMYRADEIPHVSGAVRLAAEIFDQANGAPNPFAPYRVGLYVDGVETFSVQFDLFSYDDTHQVGLDRSFALKSLGQGIFQNLYLAPGNRLHFYGNHKVGDGTLYNKCTPQAHGIALSRGKHEVAVVASDFYGNQAVAVFALLIDATPELLDFQAEGSGSECALYGAVRDLDDTALELQIKRSLDDGITWEEIVAKSISTEEPEFSFVVKAADAPTVLYSASLTDDMGVASSLRTCVVTEAKKDGHGPLFHIERMFHPDFLELQWETSEILISSPKVQVWSKEQLWDEFTAQQLDVTRYSASINFVSGRDGTVTVVITGMDGTGEPGQSETSFDQETISEQESGQVRSADWNATASFPPGSVYESLWPTVEPFHPIVPKPLKAVGSGYVFHPLTVPFDQPVTISLRYPKDYSRPEQLGIYRLLHNGTWEFLDNLIYAEAKAVRAEVRYFSRYALLADEVRPAILAVIPEENAQLAESRPLLRAVVWDFESGIRREEDVRMELDGHKLISVYDPDAHTVSYQVRNPLGKGQHTLEIIIRDACGNETRSISTFSIN